ncbi:hypothetical protein LAD12857_05470 [Lacrimispora amygdalina]|uniref:Uncharacterized protein n=1 Tax=Lacrimispora amygdalina TaxID=253257 RepID=A0ABQ5M1Y6_9FIRM
MLLNKFFGKKKAVAVIEEVKSFDDLMAEREAIFNESIDMIRDIKNMIYDHETKMERFSKFMNDDGSVNLTAINKMCDELEEKLNRG